jgi:hypothetical protein
MSRFGTEWSLEAKNVSNFKFSRFSAPPCKKKVKEPKMSLVLIKLYIVKMNLEVNVWIAPYILNIGTRFTLYPPEQRLAALKRRLPRLFPLLVSCTELPRTPLEALLDDFISRNCLYVNISSDLRISG